MSHLHAKKSLGQNFLKSKKAIWQMINAVDLCSTDTVIEIGPGKGALTGPMLETGAKVIAFELDQRMIELLGEKFADEISAGALTLVHADIIEVDLAEYIPKSYKLIANIPYYITSLIMRKMLSSFYQPSDMSLLIQKEVAERVVCRDQKESLLSLSVSIFGTASYVSKVSKKYFSPSPKVDSAIIAVKNISRDKLPTLELETRYFKLMHAAFAHKRKQAAKNLKSVFPDIDWKKIFTEKGLSENVRAEDIKSSIWEEIFDDLHTEL